MTGERDGAKGFPRFTDPRLRGEERYGDYIRMATERSLERMRGRALRPAAAAQPRSHRLLAARPCGRGCGRCARPGSRACSAWRPGPANGFTLDLIDCIERFGELIDWAMIILSPMEPWPGELVLDAAQAHDVSLIARVVDYGGLFHDDVLPGTRLRRARPPQASAPTAGWRRAREARAHAPLRRAARADDAAAGLRLEPRAAGGALRRARR